MSASEAATEIVADVAEEVSEQATHIAEVSRGMSGRDLGLVFGGLVVGAGLGGAVSFILTKRKLETKYSQIAAEEISDMRQHYVDKVVALENTADKPGLEEIVRNQGYAADEPTAPPMAVSPPTAVKEAAEEAAGEQPKPVARDETGRIPEDKPTEVRNVFRDNASPPDDWDYAKERARRSPLRPYVIHRDEREEQQAYDGVTYTYYEQDDVLCNERDDVISEEDREKIIGETNLEFFGHGSGDASIVYIRNDQLSMDIEVIRSPNSFAEEVHGFEPEIRHSDRRRERRPFDDE